MSSEAPAPDLREWMLGGIESLVVRIPGGVARRSGQSTTFLPAFSRTNRGHARCGGGARGGLDMNQTLALALASILVAGCGNGDPDALDTPATPLPEPLAGEWLTGTLSTLQYYDATNGTWLDPSGEGFYYLLDGDGRYETGAVIDSTVGGCTLRLLGVERGTMALEGETLTIHRHWVRTHVTNSCGGTAERTLGYEVRTWTWRIELDETGLEWLVLTHEDGAVERYHRWNG